MSRLSRADSPVRVSGPSQKQRRSNAFTDMGARATWVILLALVLCPIAAHAYAGPGAGFAVLSSFWAIFVACLYFLYARAPWPVPQFFRFFRRRNGYGKAVFNRGVILGFHGMDPELAD